MHDCHFIYVKCLSFKKIKKTMYFFMFACILIVAPLYILQMLYHHFTYCKCIIGIYYLFTFKVSRTFLRLCLIMSSCEPLIHSFIILSNFIELLLLNSKSLNIQIRNLYSALYNYVLFTLH